METKEIRALLKKHNGNVVLEFSFDNVKRINLESEDAAEIKSCFIELARELKTSNIKLIFASDESVSEKSDLLFIETAREYINQLNNELRTLETDIDVISLREKN